MEERYASRLGENQGWFFPEEELESTMSAWFEGVTPEQFRADSNFYDAEHHGYRSISGPGIGIQPRLDWAKCVRTATCASFRSLWTMNRGKIAAWN